MVGRVTPTILAMDAFETCFCRRRRISSSFPSSRDFPSPPFGRPSSRPLARADASMPIECTDRDAAFVLDGLLYNESDLEIEEHYTDTHGYTELNFAAFAMLGRRVLPTHQGRKAPAHLSHRRHNGLRATCSHCGPG